MSSAKWRPFCLGLNVLSISCHQRKSQTYLHNGISLYWKDCNFIFSHILSRNIDVDYCKVFILASELCNVWHEIGQALALIGVVDIIGSYFVLQMEYHDIRRFNASTKEVVATGQCDLLVNVQSDITLVAKC